MYQEWWRTGIFQKQLHHRNEFRTKLKVKCDDNGIELRIADRFYPSSKICHCWGSIKKDLKLSDRIYKCSCSYVEDRDLNASLNLKDAVTYKIAWSGKCKYVPKAISGIDDCGVYRNLWVDMALVNQKHTRRSSK